MFRRSAITAVCLLAFLASCEKKEPEVDRTPTPQPRPEPAAVVKAPTGMEPIRGAADVFITKNPVTVGEYVAFLRAVGLPIDERWQGIQARSEEADRPVMGLTREEAERYAAWDMKRLPTRQEWLLAQPGDGTLPYPWPEGRSEPRPSGQLYLVQDWLPGSEGESAAREKKEALKSDILNQYTQQVQELARTVEGELQARRAERRQQWNAVKPAFFAWLDKEKALAEAQARLEGWAMSLDVLRSVVQKKNQLAAHLKGTEPTPEEAAAAVKTYEDALASARTTVQELREDIQAATKKAQDQVLELTKKFEAAGEEAAGAGLEDIERTLGNVPERIESAAQAAQVEQQLRAARAKLERPLPPMEGLPTAEEIRRRSAQVEAQLEEIAKEDPNAAERQDMLDRLATVSEVLDREFLQESLLLQDLTDLTELKARRQAVEARLAALQQALASMDSN